MPSPDPKEQLIITREVAQSVVDYLARQPYKDVAQLVQWMLVLKPLGDDPYSVEEQTMNPNTS